MANRTSKQPVVYVGLDVHKDSISVAYAIDDGSEPTFLGRFGSQHRDVDTFVRKLTAKSKQIVFVYEAGPCGYWLYRLLTKRGLACWVVSPTMIPKRAGDRVKTDRRDAIPDIGVADVPGRRGVASPARRAVYRGGHDGG